MNASPTDHSRELMAAAEDVLIAEQWASISLLQRRLKLGYSVARSLMNALEINGVVSTLHVHGFRTLTPTYIRKTESAPPMSGRDKYARKVFELALFLWETHEEDGYGDTRAIKLLSPVGGEAVKQRNVVFKVLDGAPHASLFCAAGALAGWLLENFPPALAYGDIKAELATLCAAQEWRYQKVTDTEEKMERSYLRLARYIRRVLTEEAPPNTNIFMYFISDDFVPKGYGKSGPGRGEHVVPRKFLLHTGVGLFKAGWPIEGVARVLRNSLAIVHITLDESKFLDASRINGGLGLKELMPEGWRIGVDCIYVRLHKAGIAFDPPAEHGICTCALLPCK
ncbi:DNA translocase FtsK [Pseudomonas sp. LB3P81]